MQKKITDLTISLCVFGFMLCMFNITTSQHIAIIQWWATIIFSSILIIFISQHLFTGKQVAEEVDQKKSNILPSIFLFLCIGFLAFASYIIMNVKNIKTFRDVKISEDKDITGYSVQNIWDYDFKHPRALAIDNFDNIYVSESYQGPATHSRIIKFDANGIMLGWWGKGNKTSGWHNASSTESNVGNGNGAGEFNYIFKIAFDIDNTMYVIDRGTHYDKDGNSSTLGNDRIQRFNNDGEFSGLINNSYTGWTTSPQKEVLSPVKEDMFQEPSCLLVKGDELLVGSWKKNSVDVFNKLTGTPLRWLGKDIHNTYGWHTDKGEAIAAPFFGTEIGTFNGIIDCNIYNDKLYIVSYNSNPVVGIFDYMSGRYINGLSHNDGHKPQELVIDAFGNIIFSDNYEGSIKFLNKKLLPIAKMQLGPGGDYFGVSDFAINSKGLLYFVEQRKQKVYELSLYYNRK